MRPCNFYENVLGFTNGPRPPFNFPGAWLYSSRPSRAAPQRHLADRYGSSGAIQASSIMSLSSCRGFEATKQRLSEQRSCLST